MQPIYFSPAKRYMLKLFLTSGLGFIPLPLSLVIMDVNYDELRQVGLLLWSGLVGAYLLIGTPIIYLYYRNIRYEIHEDVVVVRKGILNKSIKYVPFQNITNMGSKTEFCRSFAWYWNACYSNGRFRQCYS